MARIHSERSKTRILCSGSMLAFASIAVTSMAGTPVAAASDTAAAPASDTAGTGAAVTGAPSASAAVAESPDMRPGDPPVPVNPMTLIRHYTFQVSMPVFQQARNAKVDGHILDWSSDGCTHVPNNPLGFNFLQSCHRHDFGYRNFKHQHACNNVTRKEIDDQFRRDMYNYCGQFSGLVSWKGVACRRVADAYYEGVRVFGNCK